MMLSRRILGDTFQKWLYKYRYAFLFAGLSVVYYFYMWIDVMEVDAAQFALISEEMARSKSFLHIYQQGEDYLDKPPLTFWLSALSFLILGISNFTYKLPSVLIGLLGLYSVYRFSRLYYSKETSIFATLILASAQAFFLMTNDIRADTNLLGMTMFAVWQLSTYLRRKKLKYLLLAGAGIGGAMLAKGPIGLILPLVAFSTDWILKRNWRYFFKPQWLILIGTIAIILLPMCYGLYTQFDLHPEKNVYDLQGPSGLKFFFWTQSFGRITGDSAWRNDTSFFYFFHTILWDFQPWILLFIPALMYRIKTLFTYKMKIPHNLEYITFGAFCGMFCMLSLSAYKLPHYIFVLFPYPAIITADFICSLRKKNTMQLARIYFGVMHIFWVLILIGVTLFFPLKNIGIIAILLILWLLNFIVFLKLKTASERILIPTIITAIAFNLLLSVHFYPTLLRYQSSSQAGRFVYENNMEKGKFFHYHNPSFSLDFYARRITPAIRLEDISALPTGTIIFTDANGYNEIKEKNYPIRRLKMLPSYKVTALTLPFLYRETREAHLDKTYLLIVD